MLAAIPLPMPGISSSFFGSSSRAETCSGMSLQRFSGAAVGADAKRVVAIDLHQVGGFVENVRDGFVIQAELPEARF